MISYLLETQRLGFRLWRPDDLPLALQLWTDPQVMQFCASQIPSSAQVEERLRTEIERAEKYNIQYWPIFNLENGAAVGCCGLHPWDDKVELGYYLLPQYWGKGYASEAARAVVRYAFVQLKIEPLYAQPHTDNESSKKLLENLGFTRIGGVDFYEPLGIPLFTYILHSYSEMLVEKNQH